MKLMHTIVTIVLLGAVATVSAADRPATVLLITSKKLAPAWHDFVEWKTRVGKATHVLTVEKIAETYKGRDVQEKIRVAVQDYAQKRNTRWVILGGDSLPGNGGHVPDRDTPHSIMGGRLVYKDVPTDLYYISPKNWDANGDGVYGQWRPARCHVRRTRGTGRLVTRPY